MNGEPTTVIPKTPIAAGADDHLVALEPMADAFGVVATANTACPLEQLSSNHVKRLYATHGAVLLRGFEVTLDTFDRFVSRFIGDAIVNGSSVRASIGPDRAIQTVNSGNSPIALHAEMAYGPFRPDVLCFFCIQQPTSRGGETLLCDGVELWARMPGHLRTVFESTPLRFSFSRNRMIAEQAERQDERLLADERVKSYRRHDDGTMDLEFVVPAVQPTRHGGRRAFANSLIVEAESASLEGVGPIPDDVRLQLFALSIELSHPLAWRTGDVLILDNSRMMHGRRKIAHGDDRTIVLKMGWERV